MILRKLVIENFRQIFGRSEIRFALPGDRNVTVVLGQNGSGKSTLLNAFLWCLYERLAVENPLELVSHKAVQETPIGGKVAVGVSLVLQDGPQSCTVTRRATYKKRDGGTLEEVQPREFRVDVKGANGVTDPAGDPKQFIQQMLPEGLSGFFFFRGEDMENLALQSSGPNLARGVEEFLNFTLLDRSIKHLQQVGRDFEAELGRIAVGDTKRLAEDIANAEVELGDAQTREETEKQNVRDLQKRREEIERHLAEADEVRPLLEQRTKVVVRKESLERSEEEQRGKLAEILSRDGFLWKADLILATPMRLAAEAIRRGELPAKVKPKFVDDLLEAGDCVCGRALDEVSRIHLMRWRGGEGLAAYEEAINQMRNAASSLDVRRKRLLADCTAQRTTWAQTKEQIRKTIEEISKLDSDLQGKDFGLDEIRALQSRLRQVSDDLIERSADVARAKDAVAAAAAKLESLRADMKRRAKDDEQTKSLQRRFEATEAVVRAFKAMRQGWLQIVQEYINAQLKENWEKVAQLDRLVEFTSQFHLSIKERGPGGGWTTSAPSSANLRALALCFVSALIKLADDIGKDERGKTDSPRRQQMFQGGDYPLVMDAPFATMDYFKKTLPKGLRAVVPQMVIFSTNDQWSGEVESCLLSSVGAAHVLELHIPGNEDKSSSISFNGQKVGYEVYEPGEGTDWTVIREMQS